MNVLLLMESGEEHLFQLFIWCKICDTNCSRMNFIGKILQFVNVCPFILQVFINDIFQGTDIFLSECGIFQALCAFCFHAFLFKHCFEAPFKFCSLVHSYFFGCFVVINSLIATAVVVAYFDFKGCTLRQRDM